MGDIEGFLTTVKDGRYSITAIGIGYFIISDGISFGGRYAIVIEDSKLAKAYAPYIHPLFETKRLPDKPDYRDADDFVKVGDGESVGEEYRKFYGNQFPENKGIGIYHYGIETDKNKNDFYSTTPNRL